MPHCMAFLAWKINFPNIVFVMDVDVRKFETVPHGASPTWCHDHFFPTAHDSGRHSSIMQSLSVTHTYHDIS